MSYKSATAWVEEIYGQSPYANFDEKAWKYDLQGWGSTEPVFQELIEEIKPKTIIEVGTWKGASAINMASLTKKSGLKSTIFCVDTWLGSEEHWLLHLDQLQLKDGYPQLFYQFLANVKHTKNEDVIVPVPQPSLVAADFFALKGIRADLVYIDASHKLNHVLSDIHAFWPLVRCGGIIFGDDFNPKRWPEVNRAVLGFGQYYGVTIEERYERFWIMRKNKDLALQNLADLMFAS